MYHVFADVGKFAGGQVMACASSDPLSVDGLWLTKDGRTRALLANLTAQPQRVILRGLGERVTVRILDETTTIEAMQSPEAFRARQGEAEAMPESVLKLALKPFAYACVDVVETMKDKS
jgi:hypothetical protein